MSNWDWNPNPQKNSRIGWLLPRRQSPYNVNSLVAWQQHEVTNVCELEKRYKIGNYPIYLITTNVTIISLVSSYYKCYQSSRQIIQSQVFLSYSFSLFSPNVGIENYREMKRTYVIKIPMLYLPFNEFPGEVKATIVTQIVLSLIPIQIIPKLCWLCNI